MKSLTEAITKSLTEAITDLRTHLSSRLDQLDSKAHQAELSMTQRDTRMEQLEATISSIITRLASSEDHSPISSPARKTHRHETLSTQDAGYSTQEDVNMASPNRPCPHILTVSAQSQPETGQE